MLKSQDLMVVMKVLAFEEKKLGKVASSNIAGEAPAFFELADTGEGLVDDFSLSDIEYINRFIAESDPRQSDWTYRQLAEQLFISLSEANRSVKRAIASGLLIQLGTTQIKVNRPLLIDFIQYGAGVCFYAKRGAVSRGFPTAYSSPAFKRYFASAADLPLVWPSARGNTRGAGITSLYPSAPKAAMIDDWLYQHLALIDIFRVGSARERQAVLHILKELVR